MVVSMKKSGFLKSVGCLPALNLIAVQTSFWFAWSFSNYSAVYLQEGGFDSSQLGVLNAISSAVAIFSTVLWGMLSDRINSIRKTLLIVVSSSMVLYFLIPQISSSLPCWTLLMFLLYPIGNIPRGAAPSLMDNLTVRTCADRQLNYGVIRSMASLIFTVGSILAVMLVGRYGVKSSFYAYSLLMLLPVVVLCFCYDPKIPSQVNSPQEGCPSSVRPQELFGNYYYVMFVIFIALLYIPLAAESSFLIYFMADVGIPSTSYSTLLALRALMEVPFLVLIVRLRKRIRLKYLIMISCLFFAAECILLSLFAHNLAGLLVFGSVFGFGNGIFIGSASLYVYRIAPDRLKASAQTIYTAASAASGIIGNIAGGFLYRSIGARPFYLLVGCAILLAAGFFAISFLPVRGRINPADEKY